MTGFGTYHTGTISCEAQWGARLIAKEVAMGLNGLVHNRQSASGAKAHDLVKRMQERNVLHEACEAARKARLPDNGSDISPHILYQDDDIVVIGSPQGSFGYLYVSALLHPNQDELQEIFS